MLNKVLAPRVNVNEDEATIVAWHVASGVRIDAGQPLAELETNKTALDVEAEQSGFVYYRRELRSIVPMGALLAVISDAALSDSEQDQIFQDQGERLDSTQPVESAPAQEREVTAKAQKLMQSHGLTPADFPGAEKITVAMVEAAVAARLANKSTSSVPSPSAISAEPAVEPPVPAHLVAMDYSKAKQQEVRALVASYGQMVLSEVTVAVDFARCAAMLDSLSKQHEFPFTLGDLASYGCSRLLSNYPELNGCFHADRPYRHKDVNVGYALNFGKGLRVPVIRNADRLELPDIAQALRAYILGYAEDKLENRQCSQGSFTITDLSSNGVLTFRPVVSPMQSAILGLAKDAELRQIHLILAFDHRMADGLVAARFLNELKQLMEAPLDEKRSDGAAHGRNKHAARAGASLGTTVARSLNYSEVRNQVRQIWQAVLGVNEVDDDTGFFQAGGTSIASVLAVEKLAQAFDCDRTVSLLFRYPTVNAMANYLLGLSGVEHAEAEELDDTEVEQRTQTDAQPSAEDLDIAIVGLACRLPNGIDDLDSLWNLLDTQGNAITEYPTSRGPWPQGGGIERGGFLVDGECFDAPFFRMSPSEAQVTDPQQRLLLETSWACFEDACIRPAESKGTNTGVFVGASNTDYAHLLQQSGAEVEAHSAVGNALAVIANRLSYFYDFSGPSLLIDTACSASLVAFHVALQSLRAGECRQALVGGVNFICDPRLSLAYQRAGMLAPDGQCKVFDDSADGYVRSEGAVMLLLKPLRAAIADGNRIHAIVKGSAVNHGGQAAGLTVPNPQKQAELLVAAWRNGRVDPSRISYLEAHGTGTSLGDPLEIEGMQMALRQMQPAAAEARCAVGSVKSNIGHLESAAGLAGVLKVIGAMRHHRLPASTQVATLNSRMALQGAPLHIQTAAQAWTAPRPLIAGVSSFGSGGANAHVLLQEYVPASRDRADLSDVTAFPDGNLFVLSAIDQAGLRRNAGAVIDWLQGRPSPRDFTDALYTWQCGRTAFKYRLALHVRDFGDLERQLKHWLESGAHGTVCGRADRNDLSEWNDALARRDWQVLAQCWTNGRHGEWSHLYTALSSPPHFVKLPGYLFSRERHWVSLDHAGGAETRYLQPVWQRSELSVAVQDRNPGELDTYIYVWARPELGEGMSAAMPACQVARIDGHGSTSAARYQAVASQLFARIKALLSQKSGRKVRIQVVAEERGDGDWVFGLRGLLKTASLEDPRLEWQIVSLPAKTSADRAQALLCADQRAFESGASIKYTETARLVRRWEPLLQTVVSNASASLRAGAYLITGGLGGLGRLFAKQILGISPHNRVILTGRRAVDLRTDADLKSWHATGRLLYRPLQLDQREDVESLITELRRDSAPLRGILHCAGQVSDNYIVNKSAEEFARVLAPKLNGALYLDEATKDLDLDFFVLFSSIMAETGNAGQADYACANGFMDQYAAYRNALVSKGQRRGHSVAIDWPLWEHGGMQIDASALALLKETRGMVPMPTAVGLDCFRSQIWRSASQVAILHGDADKIGAELSANTPHRFESMVDVGAPELVAATEQALMALVGEQLKLPPNKRDAHQELTSYGIDSIFVNKINLALSRHFSAISKTLFFQYDTVAEIAAHLVEQHADECRVWTGQSTPAAASAALPSATAIEFKQASPVRSVGASDGPIAIIGMSGVFPQARSLDQYWRNLAAGKDCVTEIPAARWDLRDHYEPDVNRALAQGKSYCKHGAFVDDFAQFDPMFFRISPREANNIDPHERLFLQEAWRAMEDAGYSSEALRQRHNRRVGVFVGVTKTEFELNGAHDPRAAGSWYPHTSFSAIANRLSYFLDLSGPSMPVDTMCSSSLTAIHHACEQIRLGACEVAFAGAVNLYLHPSSYYYLSLQRMLASDGRCRSFGEGGSGFVPGEGAAVVLLKSLDRAIADGDNVHGVILASHVNHGGRTHGFTVPSPRAQAALVRETLDKAGVNARHVSYIEAHGTGTALGDPIEVDGLQQAFASDTADKQFCALGSAKSNIGHLEAAAGIAGLIKVLLQMRHRQLVPTLHVDRVNPNIRFDPTAFVLNRELREWHRPVVDGKTLPRIAGVSSFGAGGVNAHVLIQEFEAAPAAARDTAVPAARGMPVLVPLSALRHEQLIDRARQLLNFLDADGQRCDIRRLAYTLQVGRDALTHRAVFVVDSLDDLRPELETFVSGRPGTATYVGADLEQGGSRSHQAHEVDACLAVTAGVDRHRLATLWVSGASVEWQRLYRQQPGLRRLHLPTYPFARETYWLAAQSEAPSVPKRAALSISQETPDAADVLFAVPQWQSLRESRPQVRKYSRHLVLLCDVDIPAPMLEETLADVRCIRLSASGNDLAERYQSIAVQCFEQLRELAGDATAVATLIQCIVPDGEEAQTYRGLSGLLRSLAMEQSRLEGQLIAVDTALDVATLATHLRELRNYPQATLIRCQRAQVQTLDWRPLDVQNANIEAVYKDDGVYVITGGLGELGQLFARNIVDHCSRATIILTGRSPASEAAAKRLENLQHSQTRVVYRQLDLQDAAALASFCGEIEAQYGKLNGIIHCAGAVDDSLITKKDARSFLETLHPKVVGTYHLDQASGHFDLDFFITFSSIASAMGAIGQSDYATANGFMDHFINHRRELERRGQRHGASVSINWPYWQAGGMRVDAATETVVAQSIGMQPMATEVGLQAFHRAIAMNCGQLLVAQGDTRKFLSRLRAEPAVALRTGAGHGRLTLDQIQKHLRQMLATVLHARPEDIDARKPLVELGLDSVLGTEFVSAINQKFATTLSSVGIYDHPSVLALAQYVEAAQPATDSVPEPAFESASPETQERRDVARFGADDRIAVIGMSGRYPKANNLAEFWRNLAAANNAIVEMPNSRWDVDEYYDPDPDAEGKMYCKWMGVLDDADAFDPRFFRITPQEALYMDPEQRLFLQEGYRALEDAGYAGSADGVDCGVYLGMESSEYSWHFASSSRVSETVTGNHSAIAAARLAYFLNLKGPALAVDTACSSSLVATHLACQALRSGEIDLALAGGVRLWLSPVTHVGMCKARMLSPSGQCKTFDDSADGIVMGEGVGAVVLKRLSDAERDGDHIYGVILASGINQDGKTNGITAPSVKSQIALERRLYREHAIHPESISYIEAHGTGTRLGDPMELEALATVFKDQTQRTGFCALGSVKTNIGHTAAASGVASLHKVLLCLKHRSLVPTLNVQQENRHFDFANSPFYLNRECKPWQPAFGDTRRACISSFGFSGTNAHLVIEEYQPPARMSGSANGHEELVIALSARNVTQIKQRARDLLRYIEHYSQIEGEHSIELADRLQSLAYTLQIGRAAMEERAAFVVRTLDELIAGLRAIADDAKDAVGVQRGRVIDDDETLGLWNSDTDLRLTLDKWLREHKLANLLGLWIKGVEIDWRKLYRKDVPARMSLPTYPFVEERFWVDRRAQSTHAPRRDDSMQFLHPLVHRNVSDLSRQAYSSRLDGKEFFLSDHLVNGARVLPGVAYLEMVRTALVLAVSEGDARTIEFQDHTWIQPVVADRPVEITVALFDNSDEGAAERRVDYEVTSESDTGSTLHCRGSVCYSAETPVLDVVDIAALNEAIDGEQFDASTLYDRFAGLGLRYGNSLQGIATLKRTEREVLAQLQLPTSADRHAQQFGLHPSIMDSAMQSTICLLADFASDNARAALPFSFDAMHVHAPTSRDMWAWVRLSSESPSEMQRLDIDVLDDKGVACVQIRGLVARVVAEAAAQPKLMPTTKSRAEKPALRALLPIWNPVRFGNDTVKPAIGEKVLLLGDDEEVHRWLRDGVTDLQQWRVPPDASIASIKERLSTLRFDHLVWIAPELGGASDNTATQDIIASQDAGTLSLFRIVKALTQLDYVDRELKFTLVTCRTQQVFETDDVLPHHAGVHGMMGSIVKELPLWRIRLLDIESIAAVTAQEILALPWDEQGKGLAYRRDEWFRQEFAEVHPIPTTSAGYKRNGVYVVIGGAGGLGEVWTRYMVQHFDANVVWIGRRPLDERIEAKLDEIGVVGKRPLYFTADASDERALAEVVRQVVERFQTIDGVVHSALVLQDQSVRAMDEGVFRRALAAKIDVSVSLARVFRDHALDFMLFFSSLSSFSRGAGQSNYCAGCTFKDSFAHSLRAVHGSRVKIVNWGYWGSVGVVTDEFYRKRMEKLGFGSIEPGEAMQALQEFVGSELNQVALLKVLTEAVLDELPVSEEIRYYTDLDHANQSQG